MSTKPSSNLHGSTGGGNIYYDKRFDLLWKMSRTNDISGEAKKRLRWFDYHSRARNAALTCRYFGISESCFWKWKERFDNGGLRALEDKSRRPKRFREPETKDSIIQEIETLRRLFPRYGKEKIYSLLNEKISVSGIGRVIKRHNMFYRAQKKKRGHSWLWGRRQRIKDLVLYGKPGEHVILDTIVVHLCSRVFYVKTAIDDVTKIAFAYTYTNNSSRTSVDFLKKLQYLLPYPITNIHTDNGSEFLGEFHEELMRQGIPHYFSYPHCPKQHASIERFNRTLQEEFLQEGNGYLDLGILNQKLINWLVEYNFHRPHASLGYKNPLSFFDENFVSFAHQNLLPKPSTMYWTYTLV